MSSKNLFNLFNDTFLKTQVVSSVSDLDELKNLLSTKKELNIMMGQTFDSGQPLDLMKYALFIMQFSDALKNEGIDASSNWVIADHFISDINKDKTKKEVQEQANQRIVYLKKLNEVYHGNIGIKKSSELIKDPMYKKTLDRLLEVAEQNPKFRKSVLNSVPKDRRSPEAIRYPLEELAIVQVMNTDIKVGPKYETAYDQPAKEFSAPIGLKKYIGIYLTNGILLGNPVLTPGLEREIKRFGILPYKLNSKGLNQYRIDPINDDPEKALSLIESTKNIPALLDVIFIGNMASQRLGDKKGYNSPKDGELTSIASDFYIKFIYNPLNK
jgi:hypothetical protein